MAAATSASQFLEIDMDKRSLCLLAGLKRVDPCAVEILEIGTVVSIYELIAPKNEWVRINLLNRAFQPNIHKMHDYFISNQNLSFDQCFVYFVFTGKERDCRQFVPICQVSVFPNEF